MESSVVMSTLLTFFKVLSVSHLVLSNSLRPKDQTQSDSKESACNAGDLGSILGWEEPLEKGMATHSSILAWEIPRPEEPGRPQSLRAQRGRHDCMTNTYNLDFSK